MEYYAVNKIIALQHININKLSHINRKMISQVIFYRSINIYVSLLVYIYIPYMEAYVHANSLLSFSTLCDPMDCSLPGSSAHRIFQARILGGLPFSSPGDLLSPGIKPTSPALAGGFFTTEPPAKPL